MAGLTNGNREWARRIAARVEAGERLDRYAVNLAAEALGRTILRGGKHALRPDAKDRQAGDFNDDELVPL